MTIGHQSTLSGDRPPTRTGACRARPRHRGVGPTAGGRISTSTSRRTRGGWAPTGRTSTSPSTGSASGCPAARRARVGAGARAHRRADVAHRLGRGGPRRRVRPAPRGAVGPVPGPARRVRRRRARRRRSRPLRPGRAGRAGAGSRRPASSSPGSRATRTRCVQRLREENPGSWFGPFAAGGHGPAHRPRARRPARRAVPGAGRPARGARGGGRARTSTAWRASRSSTTPGRTRTELMIDPADGQFAGERDTLRTDSRMRPAPRAR